MKSLYETMIDTYGRDAQLDMVIEEMAELTQAILKLRRAERRNSKEKRAIIEWETKEGKMLIKALEGDVAKKTEDLIGEWADVTLMLAQLRVMIPGKYEYALEDKIQAAANKLKTVGLIPGQDFEAIA